jgi:hypothetical protein
VLESFRNVDVSPADPMSKWPREAIQAEPWRPNARRIEEVLS